jgi:hypothetical protein
MIHLIPGNVAALCKLGGDRELPPSCHLEESMCGGMYEYSQPLSFLAISILRFHVWFNKGSVFIFWGSIGGTARASEGQRDRCLYLLPRQKILRFLFSNEKGVESLYGMVETLKRRL